MGSQKKVRQLSSMPRDILLEMLAAVDATRQRAFVLEDERLRARQLRRDAQRAEASA